MIGVSGTKGSESAALEALRGARSVPVAVAGDMLTIALACVPVGGVDGPSPGVCG